MRHRRHFILQDGWKFVSGECLPWPGSVLWPSVVAAEGAVRWQGRRRGKEPPPPSFGHSLKLKAWSVN